MPVEVKAADDLKLLWATPILIRQFAQVDELNQGLERVILDLQQRDPGVQRSHYGGWQSGGNLFTLRSTEPSIEPSEIDRLHELCVQAVADCVWELSRGQVQRVNVDLTGWANVIATGGYHTFHNHPSSHFSGVYYVRTGGPEPEGTKSGMICFYEPRAGSSMAFAGHLGFGEDFEVAPRDGTLILFPSFLGHAVHPFLGAGSRISVAFNATLLGEP
jgi:uncharacterized protein (TIGR02466 family)